MEPKRVNFVPVPSPALPSEPETAPSVLTYKARDWWAQHKTALAYPKTRFERALVHLLHGWIEYSLAYECAFGDSLHYARGVVDEFSIEYDAWSRIGEGLLDLLNGEHDQLDPETLSGAIRRLLETPKALHVPPEKGRLVPTADAVLLHACIASRTVRLDSGALIDVSKAARDVGIWIGTAVTRTLWRDIHALPERLQGIADPQSRLRDVLAAGHERMPHSLEEPVACGYQIEMPVGEATCYVVTICWNEAIMGSRFLLSSRRRRSKMEQKRLNFVPFPTSPALASSSEMENASLPSRHSVHFSSQTDQWATPQTFFDQWNSRFGFELDVCALPDNAKCARFFTPEQDGLKQEWKGVCWMNPPYGREIGHWVQKAYESAQNGALVVCLLPARTDTRWWHSFVTKASEVHFIQGRLKFGDSKNSAPFPSAVAVFHFPQPLFQNENLDSGNERC